MMNTTILKLNTRVALLYSGIVKYVNNTHSGEPVKTKLRQLSFDCYVPLTLGVIFVGLVRENWSPVFYSIAMHHVSVYVKVNADQPAGQSLLQKIQKLGNKVIYV